MKKVVSFILLIVIFITGWFFYDFRSSKTAADFGLIDLVSPNDDNSNGTDNYRDYVIGARNYIESGISYRSAYYNGGYPPEGEGVCTDVIWAAFKYAGIDLKSLVDDDIAQRPWAYNIVADPNIDFRRVNNLVVFFLEHAQSLTTDISHYDQFNPGDILVFKQHIGIVSDKRNNQGVPWLIHHSGQPFKEENVLENKNILYHFRFR